MSDWDDFDEDGDFEIKKEGEHAQEVQVKVETQQEVKPVPKTVSQPKQQGSKKNKKVVQEDSDDDILGDKQSYKKRQQIMANKAAENDVTKMFENDIEDDVKKSVDNLKFEEPIEYSQIGYLLGKKFNNEKQHDQANINTFFDDLLEKLQERFTSKEFQALGKQISSIVLKKQKEEKNKAKLAKSKNVKVNVGKENYDDDEYLEDNVQKGNPPQQDDDASEDSDGFM